MYCNFFGTKSVFNMGDVAASKGWDVSLRGSELETFLKIYQNYVLDSVDLDNR